MDGSRILYFNTQIAKNTSMLFNIKDTTTMLALNLMSSKAGIAFKMIPTSAPTQSRSGIITTGGSVSPILIATRAVEAAGYHECSLACEVELVYRVHKAEAESCKCKRNREVDNTSQTSHGGERSKNELLDNVDRLVTEGHQSQKRDGVGAMATAATIRISSTVISIFLVLFITGLPSARRSLP